MREITNIEIEYIIQDIESRGVNTEDIKCNILDHVCCILEKELKPEEDFYKKYENTIVRFYKAELNEIEQEAHQLVKFKYYYAMKRTLRIVSIISIILALLGILFKSMFWPGAGILIFIGLAFFSLIFIPLNIILKFKDDNQKSNRLIMTLGLLTASITTIGVLFKIMHWPYANIIMFSSLIIFMIVFIPSYFIVKYRDPVTRFNSIIHTAFMIGASAMLFALINLKPTQNKANQIKTTTEVNYTK